MNKRMLNLILAVVLVLGLTGCKAVELEDLDGVESGVDEKIGFLDLGDLGSEELKEYKNIKDDLVFDDSEYEVLDDVRSYMEEGGPGRYTIVIKEEKDPEDLVDFMGDVERLIELGNGDEVQELKIVSDPLMHYISRDSEMDFGELVYKTSIPGSDDVYYRVHVKDWGMKYMDEDLEVFKKYAKDFRNGESISIDGGDEESFERVIKWITEADKDVLLYNATKGQWVRKATPEEIEKIK